MNKAFGQNKWASYLVLSFWALLALLPLWMLLSISLKGEQELTRFPLSIPNVWRFGNYTQAWKDAHLGVAFWNSLLITGCSLLAIIVIGAMAAYPLARFANRLTNGVYTLFVAGMVLPFQLAIIPLYKIIKAMHLMNSPISAILIYTTSHLAFTIFIYTGFMKSVPRELDEAALIDGCGPFRTFWQIIFPLMKPATSTVAIMNSLFIWNDLLVPLLFLQGRSSQTIPLAIFSFVGDYNNNWPLMFAAIVISSVPLIALFVFAQKHFVKGITAGAVKS